MSEQPVTGGPNGADGQPGANPVSDEAPKTCVMPTGLDDTDPELTLCGRAVKPKEPGQRGPEPQFCDNPKHTPLRAHRRREKAKKLRAGGQVIAPEVLTLSKDQPVTDSTTALPVVRQRWSQVLDEREQFLTRNNAELQQLLLHAAELAEVMEDPEKAGAEIKHVRAQAALDVSTAQTRAEADRRARVEAERRTQQAETVRDEAIDELEALEASTTAQLDQARATVEATEQQAHQDVEAAHAAAATAIETAQGEAEASVTRARAEFDEALRQAQADFERDVAEAREQAQKDADQRVRRAEAEADAKVREHDADAAAARAAEEEAVERADEAVAKAEEMREQAASDRQAAVDAREELDRLRQELTSVKTRADQAEERHRADLAAAQQDAANARAQVEAMQTRMDTAIARHDTETTRLNTEIDRLHTNHNTDRTQWAGQQETVRKAFEAQIGLLNKQIGDLTTALDTARTSENAPAGGGKKGSTK
ncbi:hypothetical protein SAMN04488074_13642 [Lentzea albidocapillata subsp. violacea]|uniref:Uncharacterized protein n=1 Tax=Lentzea albidocapillata subsp. violacea TaxID=128104 RepID=A0A1G9YZY8_9PSEU|nr:hypothetical protein [Lentzea albidocapillata]SDN14497.1 hypothetical protein SAMN04488074_13642 [Lentzea albidocapillata subsp. violacea]